MCSDLNVIGKSCNSSGFICDLLKPCKNNGKCLNWTKNSRGYNCSCDEGYSGEHCEKNDRPCKEGICWNNGNFILNFQ